MGLFGKLGSVNQDALTPQGGLLLAAISMMAIDGNVDDDEVAIIRRLDRSHRSDAWEAAVKAWKTRSVDECVALVARSMNGKQQLVAMANLIDIAMADGFLVGQEQELLESYYDAFSVSQAEIENILKVISSKNDKSLFIE